VFTRSAASTEDQGLYFCKVYNSAGETLSQSTQVIVARHGGGNAEQYYCTLKESQILPLGKGVFCKTFF